MKVAKRPRLMKVAPINEEAAASKADAPPPIFIRTNQEVRGAFDAFIADLNAKRAEKGLRRVSLSAWARDVLLREIGREDLTARAAARREVELDD